ncbi:TetR family transcriptional regulator [Cohnella rhizosphaerae]|uniref:TetR/AcrR family transcriptional regulator n=1 Tax=Cohnella rhizosphaerae TaxID=1457232 RepID=A0A9X4QWF4_9BACL|nr:TetR family transcriptional regulator [Cohnella rhizosphaerae]MDG0813478.1 TetR/AcrR family transcriptional regulator [Cohnella rhizosphaerae]
MPVNANDPRAKRTHDLLIRSFQELLEETNDVYAISVQDITKRASVNRATFYDHFDDKYAFLEQWMRFKFKQTLESELKDASILDMNGLHTLILAVYRFLDRFRRNFAPANGRFEPLFEAAMQKELFNLLIQWLSEVSDSEVAGEVLNATAICVSWSIFGSALQWSRQPENRSMESSARNVMIVIAASLAPVVE